jgi:hypothetical protein
LCLQAVRNIIDVEGVFDILIAPRSPTLSYTQRLEKQVATLEAALKKASQDTASLAGSSISDVPGIEAVTPVASTPSGSLIEEAVHGVDENGRKSLHGSTSLFELPGGSRVSANARNDAPEQELAARRASLLNNAWRERAFERLADIPVWQGTFGSIRCDLADSYTGALSLASGFALLLDPATFQFWYVMINIRSENY